MSDRTRKLRRSFRHLKVGVFPPDSIEDFTVGRGGELKAIERRLELAKTGASQHAFFEGSYGRGKSHALKATEAIALRNDFAVAWVSLDGYNHAFNHPTRYLHSLFENVRVQGVPERGLATLLRRWLRGPKGSAIVSWAQNATFWPRHAILRCNEYLEPEESNPYWDTWLESRDIAANNGKAWFETVSHRIQTAAALIRVSGYQGLVLLFDELETIATLLWGIRQRYLSYEFLNLLVDGRRHSHCFFGFATTPDFGSKLLSDRLHVDYYANEYPSGCRFIHKWHEGSLDVMPIRNLGKADALHLCMNLRKFHGEAYDWSVQSRIGDDLIENFVAYSQRVGFGPREMIKSFVHLLEVSHQHPNADIEESLKAAARS